MPSSVNPSRKNVINFIIFKRKLRQYVKTLTIIAVFVFLICASALCVYSKNRIVDFCKKISNNVNNVYIRLFDAKIEKISINLDEDTLLDKDEIYHFFDKFLYTASSVNGRQLQEVMNDIIMHNSIVDSIHINKIIAKNELNINIKEKKIIAMLMSNGCFDKNQECEKRFITNDNVIIPYHKINNQNSILKIYGSLDNISMPQTISVLKKKKIFSEIEYINVYASGRFDIVLKNNLIVKLPYKEWDKAIDRFLKIDFEHLLSNNYQKIEYVDVRLVDKIFIGEKK